MAPSSVVMTPLTSVLDSGLNQDKLGLRRRTAEVQRLFFFFQLVFVVIYLFFRNCSSAWELPHPGSHLRLFRLNKAFVHLSLTRRP